MRFIDVDKKLSRKDLVGSGNHGSIYRVSPSYVIKIYHPWVEEPGSLGHEFGIMKPLFNEGRNVPFPVGLVRVPFVGKSGERIREGFMMQYIVGVHGNETSGTLRKKVDFYYSEEIRRCMNLGFVPVDVDIRNSIYNPLEDKLYLVDFRLWV